MNSGLNQNPIARPDENQAISEPETDAAYSANERAGNQHDYGAENAEEHGQVDTKESPWYEGLSEELLSEKDRQYKSLEEYVRANGNLRAMLSKKAEDYAASLRPEKPVDYVPEMGTETLREAGIADESVSGFQEVAHKVGLSPDQFNALLKWTVSRNAEIDTQIDEQLKGEVAALRRDWGEQYTENRQAAHRTGEQTELGRLLKELGVASHPAAIRTLYEVSQYRPSYDDVHRTGNSADIQSRIKEINRKLIYGEVAQGSSDHQALMRERDDLTRQKLRR